MKEYFGKYVVKSSCFYAYLFNRGLNNEMYYKVYMYRANAVTKYIKLADRSFCISITFIVPIKLYFIRYLEPF